MRLLHATVPNQEIPASGGNAGCNPGTTDLYRQRSASACLYGSGLRLLQPELHTHLAINRGGGREVRSGFLSLVRLSVELAEAKVTVGDERAQAQLGCERERLPVRIPRLLRFSGRVGVDVAEQFQTPGFEAPLLLGARQCHRLLRLFPRLGDPSKDKIGLRPGTG